MEKPLLVAGSLNRLTALYPNSKPMSVTYQRYYALFPTPRASFHDIFDWVLKSKQKIGWGERLQAKKAALESASSRVPLESCVEAAKKCFDSGGIVSGDRPSGVYCAHVTRDPL